MNNSTSRTGIAIDFLQTIGRASAEAGLDLDQVVDTVKGIKGSDYEDQAIAARAFFAAKQ